MDNVIFEDETTSALFKRIIHRFCNMMSAETVRNFKKLNQLKKSSALRQGLQAKAEKKAKKSDGRVTTASMIKDQFPKAATHFSLKALAYKGDNVFEPYSHIELNFIMMAYNIPTSNDNKKKKSRTLAEVLRASGEEMPSPEKLTQEMYEMVKTTNLRNNDVCVPVNEAGQSTENPANQQRQQTRGTVYIIMSTYLLFK